MSDTIADLERYLEEGGFLDGGVDVEAIRIDFTSNNVSLWALEETLCREYSHRNIVVKSMINGQWSQARTQCQKYGLRFDDIKRTETRKGSFNHER